MKVWVKKMDNFELFEKIASEQGGITVKLAQDIVNRVTEKLAEIEKGAAPISSYGREFISALRAMNPAQAAKMESTFGKILANPNASAAGRAAQNIASKPDPRLAEAIRKAGTPVKKLPTRPAPTGTTPLYNRNPENLKMIARAVGGKY